jgi:hypothetical protein
MRVFPYDNTNAQPLLQYARPTIEDMSGGRPSIQSLFGTPGATASGNLFRADGVTPMTQAEVRTPEGIAAAIAGQGWFATENSLDLENNTRLTNRGRISKLSSAGRIESTNATLNSNNNFGLRALSNSPTMSSSVVGGTSATVTFGSDGLLYPDTGGSLALPSASFPGLALTTDYFFYRNMATPDSAGNSAGSYGYSTSINDALAATKVYLGFYTTPASGGTGGGGGGYGGGGCIAPDSLVPVKDRGVVRADQVQAGDLLSVLSEDLSDWTWTPCTGNQPAVNWQVTLETESGVRLTLAVNTPITHRDFTYSIAANATGREIAVLVDGAFRWEKIVAVERAEQGIVAQIKCSMGTYAAGSVAGRFAFTHNPFGEQKL